MKLVLVETKEDDKKHLNTALTVCILWLGSKIIKKNQQNSPESWGEGEIITEKGI